MSKANIALIACILLLILSVLPACAQADSPNPLDQVAFEQNLGAQIPRDLPFIDEQGKEVRFGDLLHGKPAVLVMSYYNCPMLCPLILGALTRAMRDVPLEMGKQFEIITVSIDPREGPELASAKKASYLQDYGRKVDPAGWHFLTGSQASITTLADTVGFRYAYDAKLDQYAHPAGIMVLTPEGKIARYLFGIDFSATELRLALVEASGLKIGSPVDQFILFCYAYDPKHGRYSLLIHKVIILAGSFTVLALGGFILLLLRNERSMKDLPNAAGAPHAGGTGD
jgi:protein SCO1